MAILKYDEKIFDATRISHELLQRFKNYADNQNFENLDAQNVTDVAYAYAKLKIDRKFDIKQIQFYSKMISEKLSKQQIRTLICSYSIMKYYDEKTYKSLVRMIFRKLKEFTLEELSDIFWALASLNHENQELFEEFANLTQFISYDNFYDPLNEIIINDQLYDEEQLSQDKYYNNNAENQQIDGNQWNRYEFSGNQIAAKTEEKLQDTNNNFTSKNPQQQQNIPSNSNQKKSHQQTVLHESPEITYQILKIKCKLMWSMMVMEIWDDDWWENILKNIADVSLVNMSPKSQLQLFQCYMMAEIRGFKFFETIDIPDFLADKCANSWLKSRFQDPLPSKFQRDVFLALEKVGYSVQLEQLTQDALNNIDISLEINQQQIAVFVDGPYHFSRSQPYRQLANLVIRNRLLVGKGWRVVCVSFYNWDQFQNNKEKLEYLKQLMLRVSNSNDQIIMDT